MTRKREFTQVDVFSTQPFLGNPVAVVLDGLELSGEAMQRFARWTNLSETTFVLPATHGNADYRLRIFTPERELPFAGHPTLGSAHAWLERGGVPRQADRIIQECGAGLVPLRRIDGQLCFAAPPILRGGPLDEDHLGRLVTALGIGSDQVLGHQWVDNGPGWAALRLPSARDVLDLEPDFAGMRDAMVGVVGAWPEDADHDFEIRAFAPGAAVPEDPVTGSLNASVAQWLIAEGLAPRRYRVSQGARLGRAGEITITADDDGTVWVGGATTSRIRGVVKL